MAEKTKTKKEIATERRKKRQLIMQAVRIHQKNKATLHVSEGGMGTPVQGMDEDQETWRNRTHSLRTRLAKGREVNRARFPGR